MRKFSFDKSGLSLKERFMNLILHTPAEIYIGAALLGTASVTYQYVHESAKKGQIPLAFSEIGQTRKLLSGYNPNRTIAEMAVPPLTNAYSITNDVWMMQGEANNLAYTWQIVWGNMNDNFARELEKKIDPTIRVHHQITEYAKTAKRDFDRALPLFETVRKASDDLKPIIAAFDDSWHEEHIDHDKWVRDSSPTCTGEGKTKKCHYGRHREYDYTEHSYDYHPKAGKLAASLLDQFAMRYPDIHIKEKLLLVPKTNAENEWAMRESRRKTSGYKALTESDYMRLTNVWATGSNYNVLMPVAYEAHAKLGNMAPQWDVASTTAHDDYFTNHSHTDSGSEEYQLAKAALKVAISEADAIDRTRGGLVFAKENIPKLSVMAEHFVNATLHGGPGNPSKERSELMALGREIYVRNFSGGFDTDPFKLGNIFLMGLLGITLGAGLGFGVDRLIDRNRKSFDFK